MFANTFQSGFISIFYSVGSSPLSLWDKQVKNGHIRRVIDDEVKSLVLEVSGTNVATTYITCPIKPRASLAIRLPFLVMIVKNMKKYFTFEIQILDDKDMHRRFRVSNFQCTTKVRPFCTTMPIGLSSGWNQIQFNLADFTRRAYGTMYLETMRVQVHANVRIRRIYFADRLYNEDEMPSEYRLFVPLSSQKDTKTQEQAKKEALPAARKESKPIEPTIEPSGAPPSPVATEAQGEQPRESEGDMSPEAGDAKPAEVEEKTETSDIPQSPESPSGEEPQSAEPLSEEPISEEPPTDVIPSDEPPTIEPSTVEPTAEEPTVEAVPPTEGEPPSEEPQTEPDASEPPTE